VILKKFFLILFFFFIFLLSACGAPNTSYNGNVKTVWAMNTEMTLTSYENTKRAQEIFEETLLQLDCKWSATSDSEVHRLNTNQSSYDLSSETEQLIVESVQLCRETDGKLDITLLPLTDLWGFHTQNPHVPDQEQIANVLSRCGVEQISFHKNGILLKSDCKIDLGATAKGYAADLVAEKLKESGCDSAVLSLGGNVRTIGTKSDGTDWIIALRDPFEASKILGTISVRGDSSIITSGNYERYFEENGVRYGHIIDPATGYPVNNDLVSVTVLSDRGIVGDAYSTALFVMGKDEAISFYRSHSDFEMILVTKNGEIFVSKPLQECFSLAVNSEFPITYFERGLT